LNERLVGTIPGSGKRQPRQSRKIPRARFLHDRGTMVFDRAPADAEIRGNILAGMAGENQFQDLALSRREAREVTHRRLPPSQQLADQLMVFATQDLLSGESLSQPNFGLFAIISRNRAGSLAFKYHARSWLRDVPQMFNGHAVAPPRWWESAAWTPEWMKHATETAK